MGARKLDVISSALPDPTPTGGPILLPFPALAGTPLVRTWASFIHAGRPVRVIGEYWFPEDEGNIPAGASVSRLSSGHLTSLRLLDILSGETIPVASETDLRAAVAGVCLSPEAPRPPRRDE
jgi:hypothetical protein